MARSKRKALRQYTFGCGLLVAFVIVVLVGTTAWVHRGHRKSFLTQARLEREHDTQEEYSPLSGAIPEERMRRFLAVREALASLCAKVSAHHTLFERTQRRGEAGEPTSGTALKDAFRMVTGMFRVGLDFGDYVTARNEALLAQGMGLGEYTWIYFTAYHAWLDQPPVLALAGQVRKDVYRDRVLAQVREMIRRYLNSAEPSPVLSLWRSELEVVRTEKEKIGYDNR